MKKELITLFAILMSCISSLTSQTATMNRPQEPKAPFPYTMEEVKFKNETSGYFLAGTFTKPLDGTSFPVAILITGSGPQNRNEELLGHKPFLVLADYLTRQGIAVLRYDDRGVGESEGDFAACTTVDFFDDAQAAVSYLQSRSDIDKKYIGLIGHSEGGTIAFMLAGKSSDIGFVVSMAGGALKGADISLLQKERIMKVAGTDPNYITMEMARSKKLFDAVEQLGDTDISAEEVKQFYGENQPDAVVNMVIGQMNNKWMRYFMAYDPSLDLQKVKCPVLALNGLKDLQVTADENIGSIKKNLEIGGNDRLVVKTYEDLNHLFQKCTTGMPQEYIYIEETISPQVLSDISTWILSVIK